MQAQPIKKRKTGSTGAKVMIGVVSLAGTFGLWNLFAGKAAAEAQPQVIPPDQNPQNVGQPVIEFPPMPTLASIRTVDVSQASAQGQQPVQQTSLRQVSQPTPVPQVVTKPVFQQFTINRPGAASGSSARSGSSR